VRQPGALAVINVTDNRWVGASLAAATLATLAGLAGLAGLGDRLRGVDGTLTVSSPGSGATSLTATFPRLRPDAHSPSLVLTKLWEETGGEVVATRRLSRLGPSSTRPSGNAPAASAARLSPAPQP
jgi:hypothetical protein